MSNVIIGGDLNFADINSDSWRTTKPPTATISQIFPRARVRKFVVIVGYVSHAASVQQHLRFNYNYKPKPG